VGPWSPRARPRTIDPMTTTTRHAGPLALVAGLLFAALDLGRLPIANGDRVLALQDPLLRAVNAGYFFGFCALMLALIALHGLQARAAGTFGAIAFGAAVVGTMSMAGDMWFDGFAAPWLAEVAPQVFTTAGPTAILEIGAVLSYGLMALGWVLFGIAAVRARVFPLAAALGLIVGGLVAYQSSFPPYGVPLGLVVAALGGWVMRSDRAAAHAEATSR
jgi:hypothetical protein